MHNKTNDPNLWGYYQVEQRDLYGKRAGKNDPTYHLVKYLLKHQLIKDDNILEIGFGSGITLQALSGFFKSVSGADISPKNVEVTREEFEQKGIKNADFFVFDLAETKQFDKKYDTIMLSHVLEHFTEDELKIVVPNIIALLKPGGKLIGAVPYKLKFTYKVCPKCGEEFELDGHQIKYDFDVFRQNFLHFGFEEELIRSHNFDFNARYDWFLKRIARKLYYNYKGEPSSQLEFCLKLK
ncbi:MAG: class I SAM-dependent methyltransferase [Bacteroidales bacterium]|nr:class I SAM-dependent methyltransferase [Bacteroidales bacterium]